jgi:S1-C subfamily serine protease
MILKVGVLAAALLGLNGGGTPVDAPSPQRAIVAVEASGCRAVSEHAVGWVSSGGMVVTVAHVVRGSTEVRVDGVVATPLVVDLRTDVAVLAVPAAGSSLDLAPLPARGPAWVAHFVEGRPLSVATTATAGLVTRIDEPADDAVYSRGALALTFGASRGDSGAPVVDRSGRVVGMVFATARAATQSFAVSAPEIAGVLATVDPHSPTVPTGRCA